MRGRRHREGAGATLPSRAPGARGGAVGGTLLSRASRNGRGARVPRLLFVVALLAVAGAGCGAGLGKPARARAARDRLPRVEVVQPQRMTLLRRVELAATVEALQRVDLAARVPGTVQIAKDVDIGRWVKRGEVLVRLDVPDLRADKKHKEALLEQARRQVDQAGEARTVARQEVEEARQQ